MHTSWTLFDRVRALEKALAEAIKTCKAAAMLPIVYEKWEQILKEK